MLPLICGVYFATIRFISTLGNFIKTPIQTLFGICNVNDKV